MVIQLKPFRCPLVLSTGPKFSAILSLLLIGMLPLSFAQNSITSAPQFGVTIHNLAMEADELAAIRNTGLTWVRIDVYWSNVEKVRGQYDFSAYDLFITRLKKQGLRAILILDYGNALYVDPLDPPGAATRANTDRFRMAYATWAAKVVARYANSGFLWEIWNEPNGEKFWPPARDVNEYVALAKAAGAAIKAKAPSEILIAPATSGTDLNYIEKCLQDGLLDYCSAISVHPYRSSAPETTGPDYDQLRQLVAKYAPAGKTIPLICSEWGYSTALDGMDETKQADYLTRMFTLSRQQNIPVTIWYDWQDDGPENVSENRFGLVRNQGTPDNKLIPKPSWTAAKQFLAPGLEAPSKVHVWTSAAP